MIIKTLTKTGTMYRCGVMTWKGQGSASAAYAYHAKLTMVINDMRKFVKKASH